MAALMFQPPGLLPKRVISVGAVARLPHSLVGRIEEGRQGDVGLAVRIVESFEDVGRLGCSTREEQLGSQDEPPIAVVGMGLQIGFESRQGPRELRRLAINRLNIGGIDDPAGLGGFGLTKPSGGVGEMPPGERDLRQPDTRCGQIGRCRIAWR